MSALVSLRSCQAFSNYSIVDIWYFKLRKLENQNGYTSNNSRLLILPPNLLSALFLYARYPDDIDDDSDDYVAEPMANAAPIARSTSSGVILATTATASTSTGPVTTIVGIGGTGTMYSPGQTPSSSSVSTSASASTSTSPTFPSSLPSSLALSGGNDAERRPRFLFFLFFFLESAFIYCI